MSSISKHVAVIDAGGTRIASVGHVLFAATLIALGISGLVTGRFAGIWGSVPRGFPARDALAFVCACVSLVCGAGLLLRRTAAVAAAALLAYLLLWLLLVKVPYIIASPLVEVNYESAGETVVLVAGAWALYTWLTSGWDVRWLEVAAGEGGVRLARLLYALALIAFGLSHFAYLGYTALLVPGWLPAHVFWAAFFGATYLAAAAAVLSGVLARLAVTLSALQMGLFTLLVWVPFALAGHISAGQWGELGDSWTMTVAAWLVAETYRGRPWLAINRR